MQSSFCTLCIFRSRKMMKFYAEVKFFHGRAKNIVCILTNGIVMIITVVREAFMDMRHPENIGAISSTRKKEDFQT